MDNIEKLEKIDKNFKRNTGLENELRGKLIGRIMDEDGEPGSGPYITKKENREIKEEDYSLATKAKEAEVQLKGKRK